MGLWNVVARKLAEFNFFFFPLEEKSSDRVLTVNSEASCAGSLLYSVNSNRIIFFFQYYAEFAEPSSWKSLLHTWYFFKPKRECLSKPFSGSKEHAGICLHIGHHTARKSLFETKVSRNWHELLIVGKESTTETSAKKVAGKGQQLQWRELERCLHGPSTATGGRSHRALLHRQHGGGTRNLRRPKKLLMEHPNHFGLQHIVSTGWRSPKTLQELMNKPPKLLPKIHYLSQKKQLLPHKTRGQTIWCLLLKGNIKGEKILSQQTRKSCIRTGLITWKGKTRPWQSYRALNQANYHRAKQHGFCKGKSCLWWALLEFLKCVKLAVRNTGTCN